jgi:hypothetical protein
MPSGAVIVIASKDAPPVQFQTVKAQSGAEQMVVSTATASGNHVQFRLPSSLDSTIDVSKLTTAHLGT